jgi:CspA family cold shock protein
MPLQSTTRQPMSALFEILLIWFCLEGLLHDNAEFGQTAARWACRNKDADVRFKELMTMPVGTVKFFNTQKGYGFIRPDNGGPDVFVHISAVQRAGLQSVAEGQKLSYEVVTERGKSAASNLQPA